MCLLLFAHDAHPRYRLVVVANRDEALARPAEQAHVWPDGPSIAAGRDREAGGTWLGITRAGRCAALTNVRDPGDLRPRAPGEPSRGALASDFLRGDEAPLAYASRVAAEGARYRGYNLVVGDARALAYTSNRGAAGARRVEPGLHGLSNHRLDTPWPKVTQGLSALRDALAGGGPVDVDALLSMMRDETPAPDADLPDTGVGLELERRLSPRFIRLPAYGTRCTTVLLVERSGAVSLVERTHAPVPLGDVRITL